LKDENIKIWQIGGIWKRSLNKDLLEQNSNDER